MNNEDMTNRQRGRRALKAIRSYHDWRELGKKGCPANAEDWGSALGDILCDLHHLADARGIDWPSCLSRGDMHYEAEADRPVPFVKQVRRGQVGVIHYRPCHCQMAACVCGVPYEDADQRIGGNDV